MMISLGRVAVVAMAGRNKHGQRVAEYGLAKVDGTAVYQDGSTPWVTLTLGWNCGVSYTPTTAGFNATLGPLWVEVQNGGAPWLS